MWQRYHEHGGDRPEILLQSQNVPRLWPSKGLGTGHLRQRNTRQQRGISPTHGGRMYPAGASTGMGGLIAPMVAGFVVGSVPLMLPNLQGKTSDMKRQIRHDSAIPQGIVYLATNATKLWKKRKERRLAGLVLQRLFHSSLPHFVAAFRCRPVCPALVSWIAAYGSAPKETVPAEEAHSVYRHPRVHRREAHAGSL